MPDNFTSLFEFLPIGAYRSTLDRRLLRANAALVQLSGCATESELMALTPTLGPGWYVEPTQRAAFDDQLRSTGHVAAFESEVVRHKTGERIWVSENAHVVRDATGLPLHCEGTVEEITARVQERERLRASEAQLASMIQLVPGVVYRLLHYADGSRRLAFVSANVKALFGLTPQAVQAEPFILNRLCHPDDRQRLEREIAGAIAEGRPLTVEVRIVLDGRTRWLLVTSAPAPEEDRALARVGMFFDITAQKEAEQALRDNGDLWKSALENLSDGVWDWDIEHDNGVVSPHARAMLGYDKSELPGDPQSMDAITHPDDVPAMRLARAAHFDGRQPVYVNEHRLRCRDGRWKWVLSRGVVMRRAADGRPLRMIGTHTDIDADKQAEALRRERDAAAAADLAKSQFLSRVSHELRTPLNAILGFAQLLALPEATSAPDVRASYVEHILASGRHLLALVDDILDLSATQTGQLSIAVQTLPTRGLIDEALGMCRAAAAEAGIELCDATRGSDLPPLRGDRRRCLQVLGNLLDNAIKYNRRGGWVRLSAEAGPGEVALHVQDSGPGLDRQQVARLFQPFERVGAERGPVAGTGLGLALCRQLAEAMGGRVEAASDPGAGSTFTLRLPAA